MNLTPLLYSFWGKASSNHTPNIPTSVHPALCHMLDIGLVSQALLEHASATLVVKTPTKTIQLELIRAPLAARWAAIGQILVTQLNQGGCAAIILNTVTEAQALFSYLQEQISPLLPNTPLVLFHARFPLQQRLALEDKLAQPGWKQSPVLRYCRVALFENNHLINNSTEILKIDPELGLIFN